MNGLGLRVGSVATLLGIVGFASVASLAIFFAIGGPFGSINDWTIAVMGILTIGLVLGLGQGRANRQGAGSGAGPWTLVAVVGAVIVVVGAGLVISRATGFVLAGLVESFGFGLVGLWLVVWSRAALASGSLERRLAQLGVAAGALMAIGLVMLPGIVMRLDDMETVPGWVWVGFIGWLGIFFLFPAWSLWLGRALARPRRRAPITSAQVR